MLSSKKSAISGIILFTGALFIAPAKSEGLITFQGMIVEPSCELSSNAVYCPMQGSSNRVEQVMHYDVQKLYLSVGETKELALVFAKIDDIQVLKIDRSDFLVTVNYF